MDRPQRPSRRTVFLMVFGRTTTNLMEEVNLDEWYPANTDASLYTVEAHARYLKKSARVLASWQRPRYCLSARKSSASATRCTPETNWSLPKNCSHCTGKTGRRTRFPRRSRSVRGGTCFPHPATRAVRSAAGTGAWFRVPVVAHKGACVARHLPPCPPCPAPSHHHGSARPRVAPNGRVHGTVRTYSERLPHLVRRDSCALPLSA